MYFRRCLNALFAQRAALARNSLQQEILIKAQTYVFSSPDRHELQNSIVQPTDCNVLLQTASCCRSSTQIGRQASAS